MGPEWTPFKLQLAGGGGVISSPGKGRECIFGSLQLCRHGFFKADAKNGGCAYFKTG